MAVAGIAAAWIVFSVMKKLFGLLALAAIVGFAFVLVTQPDLLDMAKRLVDLR